jgi:uncharacterized membrane protein
MQPHWFQSGVRALAFALSVLSGATMFYVGLYQSRAVRHLWCPAFGKGCETVADAPFARPLGIPDGYIGAALYGIILLLLFEPVEKPWVWISLMVLTGMAVIAGVVGVRDMARLGHFCFYCLLTTVTAPVLLRAVWQLR